MHQQFSSADEQRRAYIKGEWGNPLTTKPAGGRILSALQLPYFMLVPPRGFGVLTTVGRTTGKKRHKCVRAIRDGDKIYLVSLRGRYGAWYRNLQAQPRVRLRIRDGRFEGIAHEITDPREYEVARNVYCGTINPFDRLEHLVHRKGWPSGEGIRDLHTHWFRVGAPVVINLLKETDA